MRNARAVLKIVAALAILLSVGGAVHAAGGTPLNPFEDATTTAGGYSTWDSDMIDIEEVSETGAGVYVAVLDTGMVPYWTDYFPEERVATELGAGFYQQVKFKVNEDPCGVEVEVGQLHPVPWIGSRGTTHGTHVASTIIGFFYRSNSDAAAGFELPPIMVRGIAPDVTIIPVKVLADYQIPAFPNCGEGIPPSNAVFGTSEMVAAGIDYATDLAIAGYRPMVINMSLGGEELEDVEKTAIDRAIENGVIVVASAGNEGELGMGFPGAYPPVISAGASGWTREWVFPGTVDEYYRLWWLQAPGLAEFEDILEPAPVEQVYVTDFSSRALPGQELDILAPGSWVRGPYPGWPGYSHLPWWSQGIGDVVGANPGNFYYVGGTSMAAPHISAVAALMLEKNPELNQWQIQMLMKATALEVPSTGERTVYDLYDADGNYVPGLYTKAWDTDCDGTLCDPVGAGLLQAEAAVLGAALTPVGP
jgi:subtilisin family serine protease